MNDLVFEVLTSAIAVLAGTAWYMEFIKRRKIEADLAVEKRRRELDAINTQVAANRQEYRVKLADYVGSGKLPFTRGNNGSGDGGPEGSH